MIVLIKNGEKRKMNKCPEMKNAEENLSKIANPNLKTEKEKYDETQKKIKEAVFGK